MGDFRAKDIDTKEELTLVDLPEDYLPQIEQLVKTTKGIYELRGFMEVSLKPDSTTDKEVPRTRVILSLRKTA